MVENRASVAIKVDDDILFPELQAISLKYQHQRSYLSKPLVRVNGVPLDCIVLFLFCSCPVPAIFYSFSFVSYCIFLLIFNGFCLFTTQSLGVR